MLTWDEWAAEMLAVFLPFLCTGGMGIGLLVIVLIYGPEDK